MICYYNVHFERENAHRITNKGYIDRSPEAKKMQMSQWPNGDTNGVMCMQKQQGVHIYSFFWARGGYSSPTVVRG